MKKRSWDRGVNLLKSMSSPYKHLGIQYFPLGGINSENMHAYLALENVPAVGGSFVVQKDLVKAKDWIFFFHIFTVFSFA